MDKLILLLFLYAIIHFMFVCYYCLKHRSNGIYFFLFITNVASKPAIRTCTADRKSQISSRVIMGAFGNTSEREK